MVCETSIIIQKNSFPAIYTLYQSYDQILNFTIEQQENGLS